MASLFTIRIHVGLEPFTEATRLPRLAQTLRGQDVFERAGLGGGGGLHRHGDHGGGALAGLGAVGVLVGQRVASVLPFTALRGQVVVPADRQIWTRRVQVMQGTGF